jgi:hypothetical protein
MSHWNHCLYALAEVGRDNQAINRITERVRAIDALVSIYPTGTGIRTHLLSSHHITVQSQRSPPAGYPLFISLILQLLLRDFSPAIGGQQHRMSLELSYSRQRILAIYDCEGTFNAWCILPGWGILTSYHRRLHQVNPHFSYVANHKLTYILQLPTIGTDPNGLELPWRMSTVGNSSLPTMVGIQDRDNVPVNFAVLRT